MLQSQFSFKKRYINKDSQRILLVIKLHSKGLEGSPKGDTKHKNSIMPTLNKLLFRGYNILSEDFFFPTLLSHFFY
jgi:hypothetical protein